MRNTGLDLLRILSMIGVVFLHVIDKGGIVANCAMFSMNYYLVNFMECVAFGAVNCYALLSGYFLSTRKFKLKNLIQTWIEVVFYSIVITLTCTCFFPQMVGIKDYVGMIFPVTFGQYWYFTAYVCLYLFIPLLNSLVDQLTEKQYRISICVAFVLLSIIPTVRYGDVFGTNDGYSPIWLMALYLVGAYIKKHGDNSRAIRLARQYGQFIFVICVMLTWGGMVGLNYATNVLIGEAKGKLVFLKYTSPTIVVGAISIFCWFENRSWKPQRLYDILSKHAFSIYILHAHPIIWRSVLDNRFVSWTAFNPVKLSCYLGLTVIGISATCVLLDIARNWLFNKARVPDVCAKIDNWFDRWSVKNS